MTHDKTGGPAFPRTESEYGTGHDGMTLRQYAAIKLRVPDSGTEWLDDMIRQAKRDEFAGQALAGLLAGRHGDELGDDWNGVAEAHEFADAMLREREDTTND